MINKRVPRSHVRSLGLAALAAILLVVNLPAEGQLSLATRAVPLMIKLGKRAMTTIRQVDLAKMARNATTFIEGAVAGKELFDLFHHMEEVDREHTTAYGMNSHIENCPVCNDFFCAMTKGTSHEDSVPLLYGLEINQVLIRNSEDVGVKIAVRSQNGARWQTFSVSSGSVQKFKGVAQLRIIDELGTTVAQYTLEQQRKYRLGWNFQSNKWGLMLDAG